ncbi:MAG: hypothetical protein KF859_11190 [Phycisphaeraceae bacterium]|nr:hypothetical protein [Phycisphaeraceae bacterium]
MLAEDLLKQAKLGECLKALEGHIRQNPADPKLRVFLFQILCVTGDWDRAMNQLAVVAEMDPMSLLMAQTCKAAISCERLREQVFAGQRTPLILGEPEPWIGWMVQALALSAQGNHAAAADLRAKAFEEAPTTSGTLRVGKSDDESAEHPFEWIADSDERLGPILEAVVDGKYYWVPFHRISLVRIEAPTDLRDAVWAPAQFVWASGGEGVGFIPVRYPGTQATNDDILRLSRSTNYNEVAPGTTVPVGHRVFTTDADEFALLAIRSIRTSIVPPPPAPAEGEAQEQGHG